MKIGVLGPGALGCLFAAKLSRTEHETVLLDHRPERAQVLGKLGLTVEEGNRIGLARPKVSCDIDQGFDLIIVLVKAHATALLNLPSNTTVLTLQNGLNNAETLAEKIGAENLLSGTTSLAVTHKDTGHIRYVAPGLTRLGPWTTCKHDATITALQEAGFECEYTPNPAAVIWQKAIVNAAINPLTALLNVPNGQLPTNANARDMLHALVLEAAAVSKAEGHPCAENPVQYTESVCAATAENISSMLQDIRNGKKTEIDALSGEIARRAEKHGIPAPNTHAVWRLVRALESR